MEVGIDSLRRERIATERQIALIRFLLCVTGSLVLLKLFHDRLPVNPEEPLPPVLTQAMWFIGLLPIYGGLAWRLVDRAALNLKALGLVTTVLDLILITYLVRTFGTDIPFSLWYVFFVVSVAIRYGWQFAILALSASIASSTIITLNAPQGMGANVPAQLGFTGFLLVLAVLFGRISENQLNYQARLAVVNDFRLELAGLATSTEVINHLLQRAKELLNVEKAFFLPARRGADGSEEPGLRSSGADAALMATFRESGGEWNVENILKEQRPMMTNRPSKDPSLSEGLAAKQALRNLAAAPMMVRSTPVGVVYAVNRIDKGFSSSDLELLELVATQAAPVVENALLWERLREAAGSEERLRIARDLHDNFLQTMAAIKFHLERCKLLVAKDPERVLEGIEKIHEISTQGIGELRSYLSALRMMGPEPTRFRQAIERHSADAAARGGFEVELDLSLPDVLPPNVALAAFQILRELLNNVAAHSEAKTAKVSVKAEDGRLLMEVVDDGKGFDVARERAEKASAGHLGLLGVEERARQANGTFSLVSEPGKGTRASVVLAM